MPYAHLKKKIPRHLDRRVKYKQKEKDNVIKLFKINKLAQREIARQTGISRRMISFILFPDRLKTCNKQFKERRKDGRYKYSNKDWARIQREHRYYKQSIKNQLIDKN